MGLVIGGTHTETPPLQERQKLIHGESRLANDGVEGSARDVFALVQGDGGLAGRVSMVHEAVVAAAGANYEKSRPLKRANDFVGLQYG